MSANYSKSSFLYENETFQMFRNEFSKDCEKRGYGSCSYGRNNFMLYQSYIFIDSTISSRLLELTADVWRICFGGETRTLFRTLELYTSIPTTYSTCLYIRIFSPLELGVSRWRTRGNGDLPAVNFPRNHVSDARILGIFRTVARNIFSSLPPPRYFRYLSTRSELEIIIGCTAHRNCPLSLVNCWLLGNEARESNLRSARNWFRWQRLLEVPLFHPPLPPLLVYASLRSLLELYFS